ncbi:hypothetical protein FQZ97_1091560 [compost metagenome]
MPPKVRRTLRRQHTVGFLQLEEAAITRGREVIGTVILDGRVRRVTGQNSVFRSRAQTFRRRRPGSARRTGRRVNAPEVVDRKHLTGKKGQQQKKAKSHNLTKIKKGPSRPLVTYRYSAVRIPATKADAIRAPNNIDQIISRPCESS